MYMKYDERSSYLCIFNCISKRGVMSEPAGKWGLCKDCTLWFCKLHRENFFYLIRFSPNVLESKRLIFRECGRSTIDRKGGWSRLRAVSYEENMETAYDCGAFLSFKHLYRFAWNHSESNSHPRKVCYRGMDDLRICWVSKHVTLNGPQQNLREWKIASRNSFH